MTAKPTKPTNCQVTELCENPDTELVDLSGETNVDRPTETKRRGRRTNRIDVQGCPRWQICPNGGLYYDRRKTEPQGNVPIIDLGPSAFPPVLPAHGDGSRERFVDELVCWHFQNRLPLTLQRHAYVQHLDGNWSNCAADNLRQVVDADWEWEQRMRRWMASDIPSKRLKIPGAATFGGTRNESMPNDLRADGEISALPGWAEVVPTWVRDRIKAEQEKACA